MSREPLLVTFWKPLKFVLGLPNWKIYATELPKWKKKSMPINSKLLTGPFSLNPPLMRGWVGRQITTQTETLNDGMHQQPSFCCPNPTSSKCITNFVFIETYSFTVFIFVVLSYPEFLRCMLKCPLALTVLQLNNFLQMDYFPIENINLSPYLVRWICHEMQVFWSIWRVHILCKGLSN